MAPVRLLSYMGLRGLTSDESSQGMGVCEVFLWVIVELRVFVKWMIPVS